MSTSQQTILGFYDYDLTDAINKFYGLPGSKLLSSQHSSLPHSEPSQQIIEKMITDNFAKRDKELIQAESQLADQLGF